MLFFSRQSVLKDTRAKGLRIAAPARQRGSREGSGIIATEGREKMEKKEEGLTYTVGAVEIRQTAQGIKIINHGSEPVTVRLLEQCTSRQDSE